MSGEIERMLLELRAYVLLQEQTYQELVRRYDDQQKRMHDLQAELEYLRMEVNRG